MARADWVRKFDERIQRAIDDIDDDALAEDVSDAVDWRALVKEAVEQEPAIKERLRKKVTELLNSQIEGAESLGDLTGDDDFDWLECLSGGESVGDIISRLLGSDEALRKKLERKIAQFIENEIDAADDFCGLTGDDSFDSLDFMPENWDIGKIIRDLKSSDELKRKLTNRIGALVDSRLEDLNEDDLPDDFMGTLNVPEEVKLVLADHGFRAELAEKLREAIRSFIMRIVQGESWGGRLAEKVATDPEFSSLLERHAGEMMRDTELVSAVKRTISERLGKDPAIGQKLMNAFFEEAARFLVARMTKGF